MPTHDAETLSTVRRVGRLAQMLLELRDEYEHHPRADTLAQIDRRLGEIADLRGALGYQPTPEAREPAPITTD